MKTIDIVKDYESFVNEQKRQKSVTRENIMESLLYSLVERMDVHGWNKKGKGSVTQSMIDTGIMKFDFTKNIKGEDVVVTITMNLNDDYLCSGGWNQIYIRKGKPVNLTWWWKGGTGTHIEFNEESPLVTSDRFFLSTLLNNIEDTYK